MISLRPYQTQIIEEAREAYASRARSVLIQLATGGGKTLTASTVVHGAADKGNGTWWLTHRRELISQTSKTFHNLGIPHGTIRAGRASDVNALVQIASIQTIVRMMHTLPAPKLIVFDEAHHMASGTWSAIYNAFPNARILGLTATPWRLDGKGLGAFFDHMVRGPSPAELIEMGNLCRYRMFAPSIPDLSAVGVSAGDYKKGALAQAMSKPAVVGDAISHYLKLCAGKRAIAFNAGIQNSLQLVAQALHAGISAEHVDGTTPDAQREAAIERLARGEIMILSNDSLFGEGVDIPAVEAVIDLSPSKSLSKVMQNWGRALRPADDKEFAYLLDHAGNSIKHGLPDDEREWNLDDREKAKRGEMPTVPARQCEECFFVYRPAPKCPNCGHVVPIKARELEVIEGSLEEVTRAKEQVKRERWKEERECTTLEDWQALAAHRGYKSGWAFMRFQARQSRAA